MLPISKRMFDCTNLLFDSVMLTLSFLHLNGTLASVSHEIVKFDPITAYFWMGSSEKTNTTEGKWMKLYKTMTFVTMFLFCNFLINNSYFEREKKEPNVICFLKRYKFRSFYNKEEEKKQCVCGTSTCTTFMRYTIRDTQRASELASATDQCEWANVSKRQNSLKQIRFY